MAPPSRRHERRCATGSGRITLCLRPRAKVEHRSARMPPREEIGRTVASREYVDLMGCDKCLGRSAVIAALAPAISCMSLSRDDLLALLALPDEQLVQAAKIGNSGALDTPP